MIFLWFLSLVIHIWYCTVFICLFSSVYSLLRFVFLFFLFYVEALEYLCTMVHYLNWELNAPVPSKGNPRVLVNFVLASYSILKMCSVLTFYLQCSKNMFLQLCLKKRKKYIKNLHLSYVSFVLKSIGMAHGVEEQKGAKNKKTIKKKNRQKAVYALRWVAPRSTHIPFILQQDGYSAASMCANTPLSHLQQQS